MLMDRQRTQRNAAVVRRAAIWKRTRPCNSNRLIVTREMHRLPQGAVLLGTVSKEHVEIAQEVVPAKVKQNGYSESQW